MNKMSSALAKKFGNPDSGNPPAQAASDQGKAAVIVSRELMYDSDGERVKLRLPSRAWPQENGDGGRPYAVASFASKGRSIRGFFYGLPPKTAPGAIVDAAVKVFKKNYADGTFDLYADFEVVERNAPPPYEFVVHTTASQYVRTDRTLFAQANGIGEGLLEIRKPKPREERPAKTADA